MSDKRYEWERTSQIENGVGISAWTPHDGTHYGNTYYHSGWDPYHAQVSQFFRPGPFFRPFFFPRPFFWW
jgi:hypothetical protein